MTHQTQQHELVVQGQSLLFTVGIISRSFGRIFCENLSAMVQNERCVFVMLKFKKPETQLR
ncbi:MAG: hypothetical protein LBJ00_06950 [Planctomycetaceae bacterium]|nr:hypothetical protein [Planctomycetaceae bacterium]